MSAGSKDAWGGVWGVLQTAESVALDPTKQKAAQEQYIANQKAARAELCRLFALPSESPDRERIGGWEGIRSLARRSGIGDSRKAAFLRKAGDLDGAIEVYQQLLTPSPAVPCSEKYPALFFGGGFAPDVVEEGRLLNSWRADLHLELAGLYREKRDFAHAITECRMAVQVDPEDKRMRMGLIDTLEDSGEQDASLAEAKEAIQTWPRDPYFHYLLGRVLVKNNDPDAAIVELQQALKKVNNHFSIEWEFTGKLLANCELGRAFEQKGNLEAAFREYRTAFRAHVNDAQCRAAYERLKLQLKK